MTAPFSSLERSSSRLDRLGSPADATSLRLARSRSGTRHTPGAVDLPADSVADFGIPLMMIAVSPTIGSTVSTLMSKSSSEANSATITGATMIFGVVGIGRDRPASTATMPSTSAARAEGSRPAPADAACSSFTSPRCIAITCSTGAVCAWHRRCPDTSAATCSAPPDRPAPCGRWPASSRRRRRPSGSDFAAATAASLSCTGRKRCQPGTLAARFSSFHFAW